ncbi:MAG: hypothetical protein J5971_03880 [Prevotella sp.]|nr:hypothetical protein [Prevotella sp.]
MGQVISGFKAGCRKAEKALIAAAEPQPTENVVPSQQVLSYQVPSYQVPSQQVPSQQAAALPSQAAQRPYMPLFAKGYNDLILRSYNELPVWQNYLRDNPRRLLLK